MRLAPEQIESFHRDGYLLVDGYLGNDEVEHIRRCYMQTVERLRNEQVLEHEQLWDTSVKKGFNFRVRNIDASSAVPAEVKKGWLAVHHCLMPHRSLKNQTDQPRRALAMHFMDARMPDPEMLKILPEGAAPVLRDAPSQPQGVHGVG